MMQSAGCLHALYPKVFFINILKSLNTRPRTRLRLGLIGRVPEMPAAFHICKVLPTLGKVGFSPWFCQILNGIIAERAGQ